MNNAIVVCNQATTWAVSVVSALLGFLPPSMGLVLLSLLFGGIFAVLYGKLSNQQKIKSVKQAIFSYVNEAVLYKHDPVLTVKAQMMLLVSGLRYLATSFFPIAILLVPSLFLFSAFQNSYGFAPFASAKEGEVIVTLPPEASPFDYSVTADTPEALSVPLRIPTEHALLYRVKPAARSLQLQGPGGMSQDISVLLTAKFPHLISRSWIDSLVFGVLVQPPNGVQSVEISKPVIDMQILGAVLPWYLWCIIFVLVGGFGAAKIFNITF